MTLYFKVTVEQSIDLDNATPSELAQIKEAVENKDLATLNSLDFYDSDHYRLNTDPNTEEIQDAWIESDEA